MGLEDIHIHIQLSKELEDYGFFRCDYGSTENPVIFYHHDKCSDILKVSKGRLLVFSLPQEVFNIVELDEIKSLHDIVELSKILENIK